MAVATPTGARGGGYFLEPSKSPFINDTPSQETTSIRLLAEEGLTDSCHGFNNLSRLTMIWIVYHLWLSGARVELNCYNHWSQLLLCRTRKAPIILLIR